MRGDGRIDRRCDEALEIEASGGIIDLAIIAAAQRVEHYEISAYGSARALAEHLGHDEVVQLLQETLDEESAADEKLTGIAEDEVFPSVTDESEEEGDGEEEDEEDEEEEADDEGAETSSRKLVTAKKVGR